MTISGGNLFVVNAASGTVGEYTSSGGVVNASLISGLNNPSFITSSGSNLFVTFPSLGTVGEYTTSGVR